MENAERRMSSRLKNEMRKRSPHYSVQELQKSYAELNNGACGDGQNAVDSAALYPVGYSDQSGFSSVGRQESTSRYKSLTENRNEGRFVKELKYSKISSRGDVLSPQQVTRDQGEAATLSVAGWIRGSEDSMRAGAEKKIVVGDNSYFYRTLTAENSRNMQGQTRNSREPCASEDLINEEGRSHANIENVSKDSSNRFSVPDMQENVTSENISVRNRRSKASARKPRKVLNDIMELQTEVEVPTEIMSRSKKSRRGDLKDDQKTAQQAGSELLASENLLAWVTSSGCLPILQSPSAQQILSVLLWQDVSRSSFVFGTGCFLLLAGGQFGSQNFSTLAAGAWLGLGYLALVFFRQNYTSRPESSRLQPLSEDSAIRLVRTVLPMYNTSLAVFSYLFSGDPSTTLWMAISMWTLALLGSVTSLWTVAKVGYFAAFSLPKLYASCRDDIHGAVWSILLRLMAAWERWPHKKAGAIAACLLAWHSSSVPTRLFGVFVAFVALRLYHQKHQQQDAGGAHAHCQAKHLPNTGR